MADVQTPEAPAATEAPVAGAPAPADAAPEEPVETNEDGTKIIASNYDQVHETFDDMNLREELLRGIFA